MLDIDVSAKSVLYAFISSVTLGVGLIFNNFDFLLFPISLFLALASICIMLDTLDK